MWAEYTGPYYLITVILPRTDQDESRNFEYLKTAAYYPFQLEPEPIQGYHMMKVV